MIAQRPRASPVSMVGTIAWCGSGMVTAPAGIAIDSDSIHAPKTPTPRDGSRRETAARPPAGARGSFLRDAVAMGRAGRGLGGAGRGERRVAGRRRRCDGPDRARDQALSRPEVRRSLLAVRAGDGAGAPERQ